MQYTKPSIAAIGYELAPVVVTSEEIESRLGPLYKALRIPVGQLEALTGIAERRWWPAGYRLSDGAIAAGQRALREADTDPEEIGAVVYAGVGREYFEPATACRVAAALGVPAEAAVYDVSNACLGMLSAMIDASTRIELGQIRSGLVVACETAREIVEQTIDEMNANKSMDQFKTAMATLTGGSGAAAVLLTDGSRDATPRRRMRVGTACAAPQFNDLCRWGLDVIDKGLRREFMNTDALSVMKHGVDLGKRTWRKFLTDVGWTVEQIEKDFSTIRHLGNMGTVSLPLTAALAEERGFLERGDRVGWLGIGSGLNCLMLGLEW